MPRLVRDLASQQEKQARLIVEGEEAARIAAS
jgi:chemotaxis protein histidine kinase CheA